MRPAVNRLAIRILAATLCAGLARAGRADPAPPPPKDVSIAASAIRTAQGNTKVYTEGSPRLADLEAARAALAGALATVTRTSAEKSLCRPARCEVARDRALCRRLERLSPPEAAECDAFLRESARALEAAGARTATPFLLSATPLWARAADGSHHTVAAMTRPGPQGAIVFHEGSVAGLSRPTLVALVARELARKIPAKTGTPRSDGVVEAMAAAAAQLSEAGRVPSGR